MRYGHSIVLKIVLCLILARSGLLGDSQFTDVADQRTDLNLGERVLEWRHILSAIRDNLYQVRIRLTLDILPAQVWHVDSLSEF